MSLVKSDNKLYGLKQGNLYNKLQHLYLNKANVVNLKLIEETSGPNIGSIIEGLENIESSLQSSDKNVLDKMKQLEQQFNAKLGEYTSAYKAYMAWE